MAESITTKMKTLFVGAVLAAAMIPVALQLLGTANLSGVDATVVSLFALISIGIVIAAALVFFDLI